MTREEEFEFHMERLASTDAAPSRIAQFVRDWNALPDSYPIHHECLYDGSP